MVPRERMDGEGGVERSGGEHRQREALAESPEMPDMVQMVVGNEYAFQAVRGEADFGKDPLETAETDSRVNQETCGSRGRFPQEKAAVAAAAGSETQETDHQCSSSRQYFEMTR